MCPGTGFEILRKPLYQARTKQYECPEESQKWELVCSFDLPRALVVQRLRILALFSEEAVSPGLGVHPYGIPCRDVVPLKLSHSGVALVGGAAVAGALLASVCCG